MRTLSLLAVPCLLVTLITTARGEETFRDRSLLGGFNLSAANPDATPSDVGVILQGDSGARREWRLDQWGTRLSLSGASERALPGGTRSIRNNAKQVTVYPGGLSGDGIALAVDGKTEYAGQLRTDRDSWPRLSLEQRIPKDFRLADYANLDFNLSFRVDYCTTESEALLDPALHNARMAAVWTLQNRNSESKDYLNTIALSVPLFDARQDVPAGHQVVDAGKYSAPGSFDCTLDGSRFFTSPTGDGSWHTVACNLIPLAEEALAAAQAAGFLNDTRQADLQATAFNLGWEIPGPYACSATLKNLSLNAVKL